MIARRALALVLAMSLALSGCASYTAGAALVPKQEAMPAWASAGVLGVGADPYVTKERVKSVFDGDLVEEGVLAIQVLVRNNGERRALVRSSDITLALPGGSQIGSAGATAVAARFEQGVGDVVGWGIAFGVIGMLAASANKDSVRSARLADYRSKELAEAFLGPGESAHGFVFFIPPQGTPAFSEAVLTVHFVDVKDGSREVVRLPLRSLEFKGTKAKDEPVAAARGAQVSSTPELTTATRPDPAALVGTWTGTLRARAPLGSPANYPAALRVYEEQGHLRWSLDVQGGDFDGKGEVVRSEQGIALSGALGRRALSISYAVTMAESTLQATGIGADNERYSLTMQKQR
ncbi:MAG: hypothetical protein HYU25_12625 [Candidatus Rokubacteria bacterium]|nr:hypothetical protein [Candidatus Rokubacteria bacterium]